MSQPISARRPLVAGNWKLHNTLEESEALAKGLVEACGNTLQADSGVEVAVAPVFTALATVGAALAGSPIALASQDIYWETSGAFTGQVGPTQLVDVGCTYAIIGHSERRQLFGETDAWVQNKIRAALAHKLAPIVCVGESLETRESGAAESFVVEQVRLALADLSAEQLATVVIAYEPIWAIGTGRTASPADAQSMHAAIRAAVSTMCGAEVASGMRILYGGSVKPENAGDLLSQQDIDGALVGGASLKASSFSDIVRAAG